jgi:ribonuclease D
VALPDLLYIDTQNALDKWAVHLSRASVIGVDTESDSFHRYREKVCLIQMTALGQDAIIDPLALDSLAPLADILADTSRVKIFHDAGYDLVCLRRDFGFAVRGIFDTMLASRLLGARQFGLAAVLKARFGFEADKRFQRSDWAQRPLSPEQLAYARYDTHYLPALHQALSEELAACGRLAWALEDFARLPEVAARLTGRAPGVDPNYFWRIQGAKGLSPEARGRLQQLFLAREVMAERVDKPPFKVLADWILVELAESPPADLADMKPRPGLRRAGIDKLGPELMAALEKAEPIVGKPPAGMGRRRRSGRALEPEARDRYEGLRELRRTLAEGLDVEPEVALGNALLEDLAKAPPTTLTALSERPELKGWRQPLFAQALFHALHAPPKPVQEVEVDASEV